MTTALYLNGVFESVLGEILTAQKLAPESICYLQPYAQERVKLLAEANPTAQAPVRLYVSLTDSLSVVSYRALIIGWYDKRELGAEKRTELSQCIAAYQPKEKEVSLKGGGGQVSVNLIAITHLEQLLDPTPVSAFIKVSDGTPLKRRTRSGGWSYVYDQPDWVGTQKQTVIEDYLNRELAAGIRASLELSSDARRARLKAAPEVPQRVQVISVAYRRNPDVVAKVLLRAAGVCERCKAKAPFFRSSDGSPYLEVHHRTTLAKGGHDTVDNAVALCPNCHKDLHFGSNEI